MSSIPDIGIDPFASWFQNSIVRGASSAALLCYHASDRRISTFAPFTHFGSAAAAAKRAADKQIAKPLLHEVYLSIGKPLEVLDDDADNNPVRLLELAVHHQIFTAEDQRQLLAGVAEAMGRAIIDARDSAQHVAKKWAAGMNVLAPRLMQLGYDGLRYENLQEGGTSFVNFRTDQVWQVGKLGHD